MTEGDAICLLIVQDGGTDGIIVQSEDGNPPYKTAYVPQVMSYILQEMDLLIEEIQKITPNEDGTISTYLEDLESLFEQKVDKDSWIFKLYLKTLAAHPAVESILHIDEWVLVTPAGL